MILSPSRRLCRAGVVRKEDAAVRHGDGVLNIVGKVVGQQATTRVPFIYISARWTFKRVNSKVTSPQSLVRSLEALNVVAFVEALEQKKRYYPSKITKS